jgi:hypothetical protein
MVSDIVSAAREHPMVVFHSIKSNHPLYDFMYYYFDEDNDDDDYDGTFHAFHATIGKDHKPPINMFKNFRQQLGTTPLEFYDIVPERRYEDFVTDPVGVFAKFEYTHVWHVCVDKPNSN